MEQDVRAQLEGVGALIRRHAPTLRDIADYLWIIGSVKFEQSGIVRDNWVNEDKRKIGVAIIVGRLGINGECQYAAASGVRISRGRSVNGEHGCQSGKDCSPAR